MCQQVGEIVYALYFVQRIVIDSNRLIVTGSIIRKNYNAYRRREASSLHYRYK